MIKWHRTLFRRSVAKEPARLEPFVLKLKPNETWTKSKRNRGKPQVLSPEKAAALKSQIDKLVELGVLREHAFFLSFRCAAGDVAPPSQLVDNVVPLQL